MKPIIGITVNHLEDGQDIILSVNKNYQNAVFQNGGFPIMIPVIQDENYVDRVLDGVDGLLFTGGVDLVPLLYGEDPLKELGRCNTERDAFELTLFQAALKKGMPILGICRGCQLINVAAGGTLYQDVNLQKPTGNLHFQKLSYKDKFHKVWITKESKLWKMFGQETIETNSLHHQAVKDIAPGFAASAFASDGTIEAIENVGEQFIVGIQWHPEGMFQHHKEFCEIFKALIEAAMQKRAA